MKLRWLLLVGIVLRTSCASAQTNQQVSSASYLTMHWRHVATELPEDWYGTNDARRVGENVLLAQKDNGGWPKNIPYHHELSEVQKSEFIKEKEW